MDLKAAAIRSGSPSDLTLKESYQDKTEEILTVCERLEKLTTEIGSARSESAEYMAGAKTTLSRLSRANARIAIASRFATARRDS
jgi:hypothetical protein